MVKVKLQQLEVFIASNVYLVSQLTYCAQGIYTLIGMYIWFLS